MNRKSTIYLLLTFVTTYVSWGSLAYLNSKNMHEMTSLGEFLLFFIGGFSSTFFAYVVTRIHSKEKLSEFHRRMVSLEKVLANVWVIFLPILFVILGQIIMLLSDGAMSFHVSNISWMSFPLFLLSAFILGGIEEIGWRGVVQEGMDKFKSLFLINFFIGTIWAFWHIPFFYIDSLVHSQSSFLWFWVSCLGYSSFLTIIYKKTKSVLLAILFHTMINALGSLGVQVPMNQNVPFMIYSVILFLLGAVALIYVDRKEKVG